MLYSINVLDGTILVNGLPPDILPSSLTSKPIYGRTFGTRNFEITTVHAGYYRTARQVDGGYFYGFKVINNSLHIFEDKSPDLNGSELLLLLDRSSLEIPTILREENSHWYSKASDAVLFRPIYYERRQVKYVMTHDDTFEVPIEKQDSSLDDILIERTRMPCLLIGETSTSKLLERFEHKEFVHIFRNAESTCVRYWLPRFSLGFHQTNEGIHSSNFKSYVLKEKQIMEDTLKGFFCYLLLSDARKSGGSDIVLIPSGQLSPEGSIKKPTSWDVPIGYHIFNRHPRFKHLIAKDTTGRLQLAGLYMAHSSLLNEPLNGKSGFITATNLVRQCWSNEPLNSVVREKLNEITNLKTSNMYSPMKLMCTFLWRSSNSLGFLYSGDANLSNEEGNFWLDNLAVRDYKSNSHVPRLLASEELALLGNYLPRCSHIPLQKPSAHLRTTETFIRSTESALGNEFVLKLELRAVESGFPLTVPTAASGIEKKVFDNLLSSWQKFIELEEYFVLFEEGLCGAFLGKTTERREMLERAILLSLKTPLSSDHLVSKLSGRIPECAAFDLLGMAWDEGQIKVVNPYLKGTQSAMELRQQIINWMCLCVLEDKLSRLPSAVATPATLKEELLCRRNWNVWEHPKWLAFEVEHCLQIRPCQYNIVKQLLDSPDSPGSVIQLNMGLGKTSVLVPMLVLELSQRGTDIVRINSLASIIHVVVNKYRSMLTSSVHNIKIFTLPFDRNKPLEACHADAITDELKYCLEGYGCFVVSPQHRNSLLLKQYDENIFVKGLRENSFYDILDESDEILSHVFQLVYAIGEQKPLPNGPSRWTVIEAFFKVLVRSELSAVNSIISNPELAHKEAVCAGSFPKLHFLSSFEAVQCDLGATLSNEFIRLAPYELEWMKHLSDEQTKSLVSIISDITYDAAKAIDADPVFANHEADILVARGCIAYGLLFHALQSRYRVEYGLSPSLGKRMAIPYEASDTPKLRSEFCHPDMAIIYTFLSYFQDGIERCHLKEALECLKCRNPTASEKIYSEWIENIRKDVSPSILQSFDVFSKVDTDNASQFNLMYKFLKYSMDVISFWLNNFVFPDETAQFDSKRITSAWNLADSSRRSNGFSGTDDNRFLLPFGVQQISPADNSLMATNAYMINCILDCTDKDLIILEDKESRPLWESLLRSCLLPGIHALIDVGGLMAGLPNEKAALFLSDIGLSEGFRGIVYYDVLSQGWNVYERKEMRHLPLGQSSFQEAECFVYFDESRCRGSDMKLKPMACGLVTLEPGLTKDKFLQGCARMRSLRKNGQSIKLIGTQEVLNSKSTVKGVLEQIIANTIKKAEKGTIEWFDRGINHATFPKPMLLDVALRPMYSKAVKDRESLRSFVTATYEVSNESNIVKERAHEMMQHCREFIDDVDVQVSKCGEECERELQSEEHKDEEEEMDIPTEAPYSEVDWSFDKAFTATDELFNMQIFRPITGFISESLSEEVNSVRWSDNLYCTENFWRTTQSGACYLRPVNAFLMIPGGRVVLVSEYETDKLLPHWWALRTGKVFNTKGKVQLCHLSMVMRNTGIGRDISPTVPVDVLTSAKLFQGHVAFEDTEVTYLEKIFEGMASRPRILEILQLRNRLRYFERSSLDYFSIRHDFLNRNGTPVALKSE